MPFHDPQSTFGVFVFHTDQAVSAIRDMVKTAYPDSVEVRYQRKDSASDSTRGTGKVQYQIPSASFFKEKRRVLLPLCNILSLMAINTFTSTPDW